MGPTGSVEPGGGALQQSLHLSNRAPGPPLPHERCWILKIDNIQNRCLILVTLMGVLGILLACSDPAGSDPMEKKEMSSKAIQQALETHSQELLSIPNVVGAAQSLCEGRPCIQVMVREKTPSLEQKILSILDGYPVRIEETGPVRTRPSE